MCEGPCFFPDVLYAPRKLLLTAWSAVAAHIAAGKGATA